MNKQLDKSLEIESHPDADFRLKDWAKMIGEPVNFANPESMLYRVIIEGPVGASIRRCVASDGGMYLAMVKHEYEIQKRYEVVETHNAVRAMPAPYQHAVTVTYCTNPGRTIGRPTAADKMGVPERKYVELLNRALGWLEGRLGL